MAACCRWPPSDGRNAAVTEASRARIDWERFERVLARHGVTALAYDGLRRANIILPSMTAGRLAAAAAAVAAIGLAQARETIRLQKEFDRLGIPILTVKGSSLALLAYGDLGMKQAWDIDLLTLPESMSDARRALEQLGYELSEPFAQAQFERLPDFTNECIFTNPSLGIAVELHWRLIDNHQLLPTLRAVSPSQEIPVGGARVRTLGKDSLFAFLCAHGTLHGWSRLKWLADVGALLAADDQAELERLYRAALALGAGRSPAVTLLLCERLLGLSIPEALGREIGKDRASNALAAWALRAMTWRKGEVELDNAAGPQLRLMLSHFLLMPGRRYWSSELRRKWGTPAHRHLGDSPGSAFLYHFLRVPIWLGRFGRRWLSGA